ncbi:MAG: hypothetical protein HYY06_32065 [Deltaproteobacteria bacterium]|nr:hypothetical protein [Deltaproteobacteria bacterium]
MSPSEDGNGARFLRPEIERRVVGPIAETLARAQPAPGSRLRIHARGGQLTVGLTAAPEERVSVPSVDGGRRERLDRDALLERGRALVGQREPVATSVVRDLKHGAGIVVPRVTARCSFDVASRGARLELRGRDRSTLGAVAHALAAAPTPDLDVARTYGEGGTGARDPRTGAVVARAKDAFAGDLTRLLAAWRSGTRTR